MTRSLIGPCLFAALGLSACASQSLTSATRPVAIETAQTRARYDHQCPGAKGTVISSQVIPPKTAPGPLGAADAIAHAEFNVGIAGCDQPRTMTVMCSQENSCFAGEGRP